VIYFYIAAGGALGSLARYTLGAVVQRRVDGVFPWGTLLINVTGSLFLGFIVQYFSESASVSSETRAFLTTGLLGGYTTFSAFSYEAVRLMEGGNYRGAAFYVGTSVVLSLAATLGGIEAARQLLAVRRAI
jgi:fluoride exporter